jgi:hypothetical protein
MINIIKCIKIFPNIEAPFISEVNSPWHHALLLDSCIIVGFMQYCWILFANISLKIIALVFMSEIGV